MLAIVMRLTAGIVTIFQVMIWIVITMIASGFNLAIQQGI